MTDTDRVPDARSESPTTPTESDEALEPVDVVATEQRRLLFYLAGRVPVAMQDLAENTTQGATELREYFHRELQKQVDIDPTDFVRLSDSARNPVIRASTPYIDAAEEQLDAGQSAGDQNYFYDAVQHFEGAKELLEQIQSRLEAVNYASESLEQKIETTEQFLEKAQEAVGESGDQVEALLGRNESDTPPNGSPDPSTSDPDNNAREAMLKIVRDLYRQFGRVPKTTELPEKCEYSPNDYYNEFGGWDEALETAGLDKEQEMLDEIEQVAEKLGRVPKSTDMDEHGAYSGSDYSTYFGSWSTALQRSRLEETREEDLLETLQSLDDRLDRLPKTTDLHDVSEICQNSYIREFGTWDSALEAAGIDKEQHLIDDLRQADAKVDRVPKTSDIDRYGEYSSGMYQDYFGSWGAALEAAGLSGGDTNEKREDTCGKTDDTATLAPSTPIQEIASDIDSVGTRTITRLQNAGYSTLDDLCGVKPKEVAEHRGVGRTKATELVHFATKHVSESRGGSSKQSEQRATASNSSRDVGATGNQVEASTTLNPSTSVEAIKSRVEGVGQTSVEAVKQAGYNTLGELQNVQLKEILRYKGVGEKRAKKLVQFAQENVSNSGGASKEPLTCPASESGPDSSTRRNRSIRIERSALDSSWETIPKNERLDGQFLLKITSVNRNPGSRKTARLDVQDQHGRVFGLNIWSKHKINHEWREGGWYAIENARGKVWKSSDGTTQKHLSSTKDLEIIELGRDFDPETVFAGNNQETGTEPQESGETPNVDSSAKTTDPEASSADSTSTSDTTESSEDYGSETDTEGVLGGIMSEFEES